MHPFGIGGIGTYFLVLWTQGVYWSYYFPCSLKDEVFVASKVELSVSTVLSVRLRDRRALTITCSGPYDTVVGA